MDEVNKKIKFSTGLNNKIRKKALFFLFFIFLVAISVFLYFLFFSKKNTINKSFLPVKEIQQKIVFRRTINNMSLEEKAAQLMFIGVTPEEWEQIGDWKYSIGGFLVNKTWADIVKNNGLIDLESQTASKSAILPFFGADQEGGEICRFDWLDCTSQKQTENQQQAFITAETRGVDLKKLGINVVFAPVLDIAENNNDFIWKRTFNSNDEKITALLGSAMIKGFTKAGIIACPKHFPGHGGTIIDSHLQLPEIECNQQCLEKRIYPFKKVIDNGAEMIMIGHIKILNIKNQKTETKEDRPASLSGYWITETLRGQLNFKGVIITDDLLMRSLAEIDYPETENIDKTINFWWVAPASVESIKAGADMVMIVGAPEVQEKVFQRLINAIKNGEIPEKRIDESLIRILRLKSLLIY